MPQHVLHWMLASSKLSLLPLPVPYCQKKTTLLLLHSSLFSCIRTQQHYCTWALTYSTAAAQKAPIISPAHVFEEVDGFQLNAKQDLLGLSPGLRKCSLLRALFHNWVCGISYHFCNKFLLCHNVSLNLSGKPGPFYVFWKAPTDRKPQSWVSSLMFWAFISHWSLRSLISWGQPSVRAH